MIIGIPRESLPGETRVAATPQTVGQLIKLGYDVVVEAGAGVASSFSGSGVFTVHQTVTGNCTAFNGTLRDSFSSTRI